MAVIRACIVLALALGLAGCANNSVTLEPVVDLPVDDTDALAAPLDGIELTVAHEHNDIDLISQTFGHGEPLVMPSVPFGDDLVIHMFGIVGAINVAYGRSCPFKLTPDGPHPEPHIFFSRSVKFATMTIAPQPRIGGHAVALGNIVYLAGGIAAGGNFVQQVEKLDLITGDLTTSGSVAAREDAVEAVIGTAPGRAILIGGQADQAGVSYLEVLDGSRIDTFDAPTSMGRIGLTATSLADGRVIAVGGNPPGGPPSGEIDAIEPIGTDVLVRPFTNENAKLAYPRSGHTVTRLGDDAVAPLLIVGGTGTSGQPVGVAELLKPASESLANTNQFSPTLNVPRTNHTAVRMPDGSVLIIGGINPSGTVPDLELFSIDSGFVRAGLMPPGAGLVDFTTTVLPDGRVLITGGSTTVDGPAVNTAYIAKLNTLNGQLDVLATDHLAVARKKHQAVLMCDGTVLISGGTAGQFPAERYNPPPDKRR